MTQRRVRRAMGVAVLAVLLGGCEATPPRATPLEAQAVIALDDFAALSARISEEGGFFDTDNLISNETGYLTVIDALERSGVRGGAYVGVGPDQNYSYIATLEPEVAFLTDVRRDNLLHHLLLKALISRSETRVEFLAALHGVEPPTDPGAWTGRSIDQVVEYIDGATRDAELDLLVASLTREIDGYGFDLSESDHETIRRFHRTFVDAGLSLRFTTFGRAPRPYYPTYRQLVLGTDVDGDQASYLVSEQRYGVVRGLHLANRIVPVVGDMSGPSALREMGSVMREMGLELTAFYTSNVEFYLWQSRTFQRWVDNLASMPASPDAVVIRSYFPNSGRTHPSAVGRYYSTQSLQPVATLVGTSFSSYWDVVTAGILDLR